MSSPLAATTTSTSSSSATSSAPPHVEKWLAEMTPPTSPTDQKAAKQPDGDKLNVERDPKRGRRLSGVFKMRNEKGVLDDGATESINLNLSATMEKLEMNLAASYKDVQELNQYVNEMRNEGRQRSRTLIERSTKQYQEDKERERSRHSPQEEVGSADWRHGSRASLQLSPVQAKEATSGANWRSSSRTSLDQLSPLGSTTKLQPRDPAMSFSSSVRGISTPKGADPVASFSSSIRGVAVAEVTGDEDWSVSSVHGVATPSQVTETSPHQRGSTAELSPTSPAAKPPRHESPSRVKKVSPPKLKRDISKGRAPSRSPRPSREPITPVKLASPSPTISPSRQRQTDITDLPAVRLADGLPTSTVAPPPEIRSPPRQRPGPCRWVPLSPKAAASPDGSAAEAHVPVATLEVAVLDFSGATNVLKMVAKVGAGEATLYLNEGEVPVGTAVRLVYDAKTKQLRDQDGVGGRLMDQGLQEALLDIATFAHTTGIRHNLEVPAEARERHLRELTKELDTNLEPPSPKHEWDEFRMWLKSGPSGKAPAQTKGGKRRPLFANILQQPAKQAKPSGPLQAFGRTVSSRTVPDKTQAKREKDSVLLKSNSVTNVVGPAEIRVPSGVCIRVEGTPENPVVHAFLDPDLSPQRPHDLAKVKTPPPRTLPDRFVGRRQEGSGIVPPTLITL